MYEIERREVFERLEAQIRKNSIEIIDDVRKTLNDDKFSYEDKMWCIRDAGNNLMVLMRMLDMATCRTLDSDSMEEHVPEESFMVNYATRYTKRSKW